MKRSALASSLWAVFGNGAQLVVSLLTFLYLARVLNAADFGVMAVAAIIVDLLVIVSKLGQVEALLQDGVEDRRTSSTSFWLLMLLGAAGAVFCVVVATPFSMVMKSPTVAELLLILAPIPLLQNVGQVSEAKMRAKFGYKGIAVRNILATTVGAGVAVWAVSQGHGVYAMALQRVAFSLTYSVIVYIAEPFIPLLAFDRLAARRLSATGFDISVNNTLLIANGRIVDFNIGTFLGLSSLGVSRVAWRLHDFALQLVVAPITSVSVSVITAIRDEAVLKATYLRYVETIVVIAAPLFLGLSVVSRDLIQVSVGDKWAASAEILSLLSLAALGGTVSLLFGPVMLARKMTGKIRTQAIAQALFTGLVSIIAAQFSLIAVVLAHVIRVYVFAVLNIRTSNRLLGVKAAEFIKVVLPSVVSAITMAVLCWGVQTGAPGLPALPRLALTVVVGGLAYPSALFLGDRLGLWRGYVKQTIAAARAVLTRKAASPIPGVQN
jgi:O-antigen/teichoic acid export membrane protein